MIIEENTQLSANTHTRTHVYRHTHTHAHSHTEYKEQNNASLRHQTAFEDRLFQEKQVQMRHEMR